MHYMGLANHSTYAATKAALRSYPRTWAAEFKDSGIRANPLIPGVVDMTRRCAGLVEQVPLPKITPDHYDRTFALSGKAPLDCRRRRHGDVS